MSITVTHAPDDTLAFAAAELQSYLGRMLPAGAAPAFALAVRAPQEGENDAFRVDVSPAGGVIEGNCPRAVLLGVYDLLHSLGCRFWAPGRDKELVPAIGLEDLSARIRRTASYRHRGVCIEGADSRENILAFIDWLPKLGFNSFFLQFKNPYPFLARWRRHEHNPLLPPEPVTVADGAAVMAEAQGEMARRGLALHKVGHGWTGQALGYEALGWSPDAAPLAEELRPLAAELDGVRGLYHGVPAETNLCLSNPQARERLISLVTDYARQAPEVDYLHFWMADYYNNVCECPACRRTTLSDQYVSLLNEIDRRLTEAGLDTRIVFLLYQELLWPPVRERLIHPDRFVMMFAPISRTFQRSYDPDAAGTIPPYRRNRITLPGSLEENLAFLRRWQEIFDGDSFLYDYPLGRAHYGDLGYVHIARIIHRDIRRLRRLGLNGYVSCQELRAGSPNFLPNYVMGRTLLDADADFDALTREYFSAAYGPRADRAREFLEALSACQLCDYVNGSGPRTDPSVAAAADRAQALCQTFLSENDPAPDGSGAWGALLHHARYAALLARALGLLARGRTEEANGAWGEMAAFIRAEEMAYQPWLDVYRVQDVTTVYTGFQP